MSVSAGEQTVDQPRKADVVMLDGKHVVEAVMDAKQQTALLATH
ncbi:hypothetical protein ACNKHR_28300 [Shigella flexneri]